nr:flagellar hook-length control protein FliK [Rhodoferax sp.]
MATALSPAGVASSNTPAAVSTPSLSPEVGSSEWGKALGQQVVQMGKAGHQVAELQLNPPGLGPLKVTLSMNDNQIQALFVSAHSSVRAAVEAALPQLRATLADSGISLGNTSVSAGSQQQQTAFAHSQNGQPDQRSFRSNSRVDMAALSARAVTEPLRQSNGITVDTYA